MKTVVAPSTMPESAAPPPEHLETVQQHALARQRGDQLRRACDAGRRQRAIDLVERPSRQVRHHGEQDGRRVAARRFLKACEPISMPM